MTVETSAIAPNVVDPFWFEREELTIEILNYIEPTNQQQPKNPQSIPIYLLFETLYFPTDDREEIAGMVHPKIHGNDYHVLNPGEPMFIEFDGKLITYQGSTFFPVFTNEAAYWKNKIAMYLTTKNKIVIPAVKN